jgi:hypothetical protein
MLQIGETIISLDILEKKFCCDLTKCKGYCCVHGDSGAPLKNQEAELIRELYPLFKPFMRKEGIAAVEKNGYYTIDKDDDMVTPLVNNEECAYAIFEKGIAKCAIEKAFEAKIITFQKPISCHLYPIRTTKYSKFEALNYHQWEICKPALEYGKKAGISLYVFLQDPLRREYGADWFHQLQLAAKEIERKGSLL